MLHIGSELEGMYLQFCIMIITLITLHAYNPEAVLALLVPKVYLFSVGR